MAESNSKGDDSLLKHPLYVFDLPGELLESLINKATSDQTPTIPNQNEPEEDLGKEASATAGATSCKVCQVTFQGVEEQREHVKSDHHRYNLKARLRGTATLNESEFNKAIGDLDESISGSESESDDNEDEAQRAPNDTLAALLRKQAKIASPVETVTDVTSRSRGAGKQPVLWFTSPLLPENTFLGIYRGLFTNIEQDEPDHLVDSLRKKQTSPLVARGNQARSAVAANASHQGSPHAFLCMIGGGHFAAMIVALAPEIHKKAGVKERQARILAHKTFHRYTTRRKQGGAQSANDASKGAAHSAGSTLRRYNEVALENEIRQLLKDWKSMIDQSQLLFVRATGSTNRRIIFGPYEGQVLKQSDPRLRGIPFSTRRATQSELMRAFMELTRVKVSHVDESALAAAEEKRREAAPKPLKSDVQPQKPKISKEDETAMFHTSQIQALIRRSKAPALLSYLANNSIPQDFRFFPPDTPQNYRSPTPLHLAASSNSPAIVMALLTKANSNPTLLNADEKSPFQISGDRPTRDAFRVARYELGESAWDWDGSHVPSALSKETADSRAERERKTAEEEEAQRRKEEIERLRKADTTFPEWTKRSGRRVPASVQKSGADKREEEMRGMTPELRVKLERERRARAAEERIRRMQGGAGS